MTRSGGTAFVLSGGGNQGVSQIGMLRALVERGIRPDVVVGTSAGALNGAAFCAGPDLAGLEHLAATWERLRGEDLFPGRALGRAWKVLRRGTHLFPNSGLAAVIDAATPARRFDDLALPLRVIATDLERGEEIVLAAGALKPALLASTALPGVFPIVEHAGRRLVDGGVLNSVPLWHALAGPVRRVFVCSVAGSAGTSRPRSALDVLTTCFAHARNQRYELELRHVPDSVEVIVLPRPADARDLFDFSGARRLIDEAHDLAARHLDEPAARPIRLRLRRWRRAAA